jgi:hypothetical protein
MWWIECGRNGDLDTHLNKLCLRILIQPREFNESKSLPQILLFWNPTIFIGPMFANQFVNVVGRNQQIAC